MAPQNLGPNQRKDINLNDFIPKAATFPIDLFAERIRNRLIVYKTQARMGNWQLSLRNMADEVDTLRYFDRPDLLAFLCDQTASILVERGAKVSGLKLRAIAENIFIAPDPYALNLDKSYEQIIPLIGRGIAEVLNKGSVEPLVDTIDIRESVILSTSKSDQPVEIPDFTRESQKVLYRLVNEQLGAYEQNTLCLKLDTWEELALALLAGGLESEFPHPQRTVVEKLLKVGEREQILFCALEAERFLEPVAVKMLEDYLQSTINLPPMQPSE